MDSAQQFQIIAPEVPNYIVPSEMSPPINAILVTDVSGLVQVEKYLETATLYTVDLETNVTDDFVAQYVRTIQLGDKNVQYIIDLLPFAGSLEALKASQGNYGVAADLLLGPVMRVLQPSFENHEITKVGVGLEFEYKRMRWCFGIRMTGLYCTLLAEKNIYAGLVHFMASGFWDMINQVKRYTGLQMDPEPTGKTFGGDEPLTQKQIDYCALDVRLPLAVRSGQMRLMEADNLVRSAQIEFDAISPFGDMHLNGVMVSQPAWRKVLTEKLWKKKQVVQALDRWFIPIVGRKGVSDEERGRLEVLEEKWRTTEGKTEVGKRMRKSYRQEFMNLRHDIAERSKEGHKCQGEAFINFNSPKQLKEAFIATGVKATSVKSTNDEALEQLAEYPDLTEKEAFASCNNVGDPASGLLLKLKAPDLMRLYRSLEKSVTTYGEAWVLTHDEKDEAGAYGLVNPATGRIHSNILQFGAATGRTSSQSPNIQNIPRGSAYRQSFVARPGFKLLTIDYNGCELRIMAESAQEMVWIDAFNKDWDVHSVGAEIIYAEEWLAGAMSDCSYFNKVWVKELSREEDHQKCKCPAHKDLRGRVKAVNFGIAYGKGAKALAIEAGITEAQGEDLLVRYKKAFPTIFAYLEKCGQDAKTYLETRTLNGKRRRWIRPSREKATQYVIEEMKERKIEGRPTERDITRRLKGMYSAITREGKNAPIQGLNAEMAKRAMFLIWLRLDEFGAFFYNMIHDELVIECPDETAEACFKFCSDTMTQAGGEFVKSIAMTTEGTISQFWDK